MKWLVLLVALALAVFVGSESVVAQSDPLAAAQRSHIDANVPDAKDFDAFLVRDLTDYLTDKGDTGISVKVELLRKQPTQSGVAFPKYYVWLQKFDSKNKIMEEGAVRIAAVEKTHFDVVQYYTREKILGDPDLISKVFPRDVYEKIMVLAKVK